MCDSITIWYIYSCLCLFCFWALCLLNFASFWCFNDYMYQCTLWYFSLHCPTRSCGILSFSCRWCGILLANTLVPLSSASFDLDSHSFCKRHFWNYKFDHDCQIVKSSNCPWDTTYFFWFSHTNLKYLFLINCYLLSLFYQSIFIVIACVHVSMCVRVSVCVSIRSLSTR